MKSIPKIKALNKNNLNLVVLGLNFLMQKLKVNIKRL